MLEDKEINNSCYENFINSLGKDYYFDIRNCCYYAHWRVPGDSCYIEGRVTDEFIKWYVYKYGDKKLMSKGKEEKVEHPSHYNGIPGIECIDVVRHMNFNIGNSIKYLWRAGLKNEEGYTNQEKEIEDLKKAIWYINDQIKLIENGRK